MDRLARLQPFNHRIYHIVHFDGHGRFGDFPNVNGFSGLPMGPDTFATPTGALAFEKDALEHSADPITAAMLADLLRRHNIPLIALNACQAAMQDEEGKDPFASVAASLLQAGIRSVVAMSYSLWVSGAKQFVPAFYRRLFADGDTASAMRAGRQEMYHHQLRDTSIGQAALHDWLVPVLYQQEDGFLPKLKPGQWRPSNLPAEAQNLGDYGFIGCDRAIQKLERAIRGQPAGILIHGMAGEGKTTLVKGFLHWLEATNGLGHGAFWFSFQDIHSASYVINMLASALFGVQAMALPTEQKLAVLIQALRDKSSFIVWDNFELASGITSAEVSPLLSENNRDLLKKFLAALYDGKTKVLITSRSPENWLAAPECYRLPLEGLKGEELWQYCNAVVADLGLSLDRDSEAYQNLMTKLAGNPLAVRTILLRLREKTAVALLAELEDDFRGMAGDEGSKRIQAALSVFERGLDKSFAPALRLLGLHEGYADTNYIGSMLKETGDTATPVARCFTTLESAGLCRAIGDNIYSLHPALRDCLSRRYAAGETDKRTFVGFMGTLADHYGPKQPHEQRHVFTLFAANFHRALKLAEELDMREHVLALFQALTNYALNSRNFSEVERLSTQHAEAAKRYGKAKSEAISYLQLGMAAVERRNFATAEEWCKKSLDIFLKLGDEHGTVIIYHQLGMVSQQRRNFDAAEDWYKKSLQDGNEHGAASTYHQLGIIAEERRDFAAAEDWYQKALTIKLKLGNKYGAASTYHQLGMVAQQREDFSTAEDWYQKSLAIKLKLGDEYGVACTYHQLGMIAQERRNFDATEDWYKRALAIFLKLGDEHGATITYHQLGSVAEERRDFDAAEDWYQKSLAIKLKLGNEHGAAITYHQLGKVAEERRDFAAAEDWYKQSLATMLKQSDPYNVAATYQQLKVLAEQSGKPDEAIGWKKQAQAVHMMRDEELRSLDTILLTSDPNLGYGYLISLKEELVTCCGAKVILLGATYAGKTSLAKLWEHKRPVPNTRSTHGLEIGKAKIEIDNELYELKIWDFGGQDEYRALHTLFLSERAICVIIMNAAAEIEETPDEWLYYIDTYAQQSPIILVLNKVDIKPNTPIKPKWDIDHYTGRIYPVILRMSCLYPDKGYATIKEFEEAVKHFIVNDSSYRYQYKKNWVEIWGEIQARYEKGDSYLRWRDFLSICNNHGIKEDSKNDQIGIVNVMVRWGLSLHFGRITSDTYILNPNWVLHGVYKILHSNVHLKGIVLSFDDFLCAIQDKNATYNSGIDYNYDEHEAEILLKILEDRNLCIQIDKRQNEYFMPLTLPEEKPNNILDTSSWLTSAFRFNFLPSSLLHQLLVNCWPEIHAHNPVIAWRSGAVLYFGEKEVSAIIESNKNTIFIHLDPKSGDEAERCEVFLILRNKINALIKRERFLPGSVREEIKIIIANPSLTEEYVGFDILLQIYKHGGDTHYLQHCLYLIPSIKDELQKYCFLKERKTVHNLSEKITVLFLASNPERTEQLRLDEEVRSIQEMIQKSELRDSVHFCSRWAVRPEDILQAINEEKPTILHFSGHGAVSGELVLQNQDGAGTFVSQKAIVEAIATVSDCVRLVFFNACFSAGQAAQITDHIEAAIGMSKSISDQAARVFAAQFYSSIGFGFSLEKSFSQAGAQLQLMKIPETDTPQLFVHKNKNAKEIFIVQPSR